MTPAQAANRQATISNAQRAINRELNHARRILDSLPRDPDATQHREAAQREIAGVCAAQDCARPQWSRGFCTRHFQQVWAA